MTRRGSDTSASEASPDAADPDALFDLLVAEDVLAVEGGTDAGDAAGDDAEDAAAGAGGRVRTTDAFDATHAVYHDSYAGVSEAEFREAMAAAFGLPDAETAADAVADRQVSCEEFACYLAVQSHLDREVTPAALATMAGMVHAVVPDSPVPAALADATDDPSAFVAGRDRAVVTVWTRFCDPCESLEADLDAVLDAVPGGVAVAGIDGEVATDFCETHGVDAAPGVVLVRASDGTTASGDASSRARRTLTGCDADEVVAALRSFFGSDVPENEQ